MQLADQLPDICGRVAIGTLDELTREIKWRARRRNQIQVGWGFIAAQCIGKGLRNYRINALYLEYSNVADPSDPVTIPSFKNTDGREYYDDLQSSGTLDYLRLPLPTDPTLGIAGGFGDFFTPGVDGNSLTFLVPSAGSVGINGKPFSDTVNSKVYGVAAVATPVFSDLSQDIIFARAYYDPSDQVVKEPSKQIVVSWEFDFTVNL